MMDPGDDLGPDPWDHPPRPRHVLPGHAPRQDGRVEAHNRNQIRLLRQALGGPAFAFNHVDDVVFAWADHGVVRNARIFGRAG